MGRVFPAILQIKSVLTLAVNAQTTSSDDGTIQTIRARLTGVDENMRLAALAELDKVSYNFANVSVFSNCLWLAVFFLTRLSRNLRVGDRCCLQKSSF